MTVENEAPGKRSTCDLQGASKCSSKANVGCCRRFHWRAAPVFIWWSLFSLASGLIRSKHRCSRRTCKRTLIQTPQSKRWNIDWSTCWAMHANILTECSALQLCVTATAVTVQIIWSSARRVINSMRGRSPRMIMMIGRASFIGLIPRRWITIAATQWQFLATWCSDAFVSLLEELKILFFLYTGQDCVDKIVIASKKTQPRWEPRRSTSLLSPFLYLPLVL